MGIGRQLVVSLERFFSSHKVRCYRLDTLVNNQKATAFYEKLGFRKIDERAGSLIFVKAIEA